MFLHTGTIRREIVYVPCRKNAAAVDEIVRQARKLQNRAHHTTIRTTVGNWIDHMSGRCDQMITLMMCWEKQAHLDAFWGSEEHQQWCRFILKGWKQKGSIHSNPLEELIGFIQRGEELPEMERDMRMSDEEIFCETKRIFNGIVQ